VSGDLISAGGLNIIVGVGFIRPEQLVVGGGILGRRSLLPKDGCGLDKSSPYRFLLDAGESPSPKWSPIKGEEKKNN